MSALIQFLSHRKIIKIAIFIAIILKIYCLLYLAYFSIHRIIDKDIIGSTGMLNFFQFYIAFAIAVFLHLNIKLDFGINSYFYTYIYYKDAKLFILKLSLFMTKSYIKRIL